MGWVKKVERPPSARHLCCPPGAPSDKVREMHPDYQFPLNGIDARPGSLWECDECGDLWKLSGYVEKWTRQIPRTWLRRRPKDEQFTKRQLRKMAKQIGIKPKDVL